MSRNILKGLIIVLCFVSIHACHNKNVPLNKKQFTALLIDMHRLDGTLVTNRGMRGGDELKNYTYYNDLFKRYGITRAEFDSCMYYYSAQSIMFSEMYDVILDSLNKQLTSVDKVLNALKAKDTVNYFPRKDTLLLDTVNVVVIDSIMPGLYKFSTKLQFDSLAKSRTRRLLSFFVSADGKDTLRMSNIMIPIDTIVRTYRWEQYVDSAYSHLVIRYLEEIPKKDWPKSYDKKGKELKSKETGIRLEEFGGKSWDNQLMRPYIGRTKEERFKRALGRR